MNWFVHRLRGDRQRLLHRHARAQRQREAAGEACERGLVHDLAGQRHTQAEAIPGQPPGRRADPCAQRERGRHRGGQQPGAVVHREVRRRHQQPGGQRQLGIEALEHTGEGRHHHHIDHADGGGHRRQHEHRVAQRRLHLLLHRQLELQVVEQAQETLRPAGRSSRPRAPWPRRTRLNTDACCASDIDSSMPDSRLRRTCASVDFIAWWVGRFLQAGQRAQDRHARSAARCGSGARTAAGRWCAPWAAGRRRAMSWRAEGPAAFLGRRRAPPA